MRVIVLAIVLLMTGAASASEKLGTVSFPTSCSAGVQSEFDRGVALLHSFWFGAAEKAFTTVAQRDPGCAMAHWGIAMVNLGNPLGGLQPPHQVKAGWEAVERAKAAGARTPRERDYIAAIETYYKDAEKVDRRTRVLAYERAMADLAQRYPQDREATIFYALSLNMTAVPTDKTYANQLKAAGLLEKVFAEQPEHPGVAHYLIHSYDYPAIAQRGLPAAKRYAAIAPSAAHARHMPSHVFTRVGAWQDSIDSNRASAEVGDQANRFHAFDYMVYGYLQQARDVEARRVVDEVVRLSKVERQHPLVVATGYAAASIPARYAVERRRWDEAAKLTLPAADFEWNKYPFAEAQTIFARGLGAARTGDLAGARRDIDRLSAIHDALTAAKNAYWAGQVDIQRRTVTAWVTRADGRNDEAIAQMRAAADAEDATEKHIVTPGLLAPARELLGEMLLEANRAADALREFETSQKKEPNRFRGYHGAARAAAATGDRAKAREHYEKLLALTAKGDGERPEIREARTFVGR